MGDNFRAGRMRWDRRFKQFVKIDTHLRIITLHQDTTPNQVNYFGYIKRMSTGITMNHVPPNYRVFDKDNLY